MTGKKTGVINFEKSLTELEDVVTVMEKGSLTLEESLKYFERGIDLSKQCQNALTAAEQKVQILVGEGKEAELQPVVYETEDATEK